MASRKSFLIRINEGLLKEIDAWAQQELRSVNSQIEYILKQAVLQRTKGKARDDGQDSGTGNQLPGQG
jgi:hypothetical protein